MTESRRPKDVETQVRNQNRDATIGRGRERRLSSVGVNKSIGGLLGEVHSRQGSCRSRIRAFGEVAPNEHDVKTDAALPQRIHLPLDEDAVSWVVVPGPCVGNDKHLGRGVTQFERD